MNAEVEFPANLVKSSRSLAGDLVCIITFLRPSMSDLATAFSVTKDDIYDWLGGAPVPKLSAVALANLVAAVDMLSGAGIPASARLVRRPVQDGMTLLDTLRDGGSVTNAAAKLLSIKRDEQEQRKRLAVKFEGRLGRCAFNVEDY